MNDDTSSQIAALQRQVFTLLVALIVVSGTLTVFLYRQSRLAGKDIEAIKPQAQQIISAFAQNQPIVSNFVSQVVAYGQAHPDFRPVLMKNGIVLQQAPTSAAPAAAPTAPTAPKK